MTAASTPTPIPTPTHALGASGEGAHETERGYWLTFAACVALLCLPILTTAHPPLVDYPSHIARAYVLRHYDDTPLFREWWVRTFAPIPNVAVDWFMYVLLGAMDAYRAGRVFLLVIVVAYAASIDLLFRAVRGRRTWAALPCTFFVYNSMLLFGFLNYVLGLALAQIALAAWWRARRRWTALRLVGVSVLALACYFTHLSAYAILALCCAAIATWELWTGTRRLRMAFVDAVPLLPPILVFVAFMQRGGSLSAVQWSLAGKVVGLFPLVVSYDRIVTALAALTALAVVVVVARYRRQLELHPSVLLASATLLASFIVAPWAALTGTAVDQRFVPTALLLLCVGISVPLSRRSRRLLLSAVLAVSVVRLADVWRHWTMLDRDVAVAIDMLGEVPVHARIYPLYLPPPGLAKDDRTLAHLAGYAIISRQAYEPTMLALRGQQPLYYRRVPVMSTPAALLADPSLLVHDYDVVWLRGSSPESQQLMQRCCTRIDARDGFQLWMVHPDTGVRAPTRR